MYNVLYARIALDTEFLDEVMGAETEAGAGRVDEFTGQLWRSWKRMRDEGIPEVRLSTAVFAMHTLMVRTIYSPCI